ncbi:hypothetical protein AB0M43_02035 [Longispora sp. NPDC051575]|uniref:hypothetical protein n=1 Tax=Longispora sp. NPDC051575 TaxID=3154943 RepID=UPI0034491A02
MSVRDERGALTDSPVSLFDHAARLHAAAPDRMLPDGGRPYPDHGSPPRRVDRRVPLAKRKQVLRDTLERHFRQQPLAPRALHDALLVIDGRAHVVASLVEMGLDLPQDRARADGVWLARHGADRGPAMVGLALLVGTARPGDVVLIRTLGLLSREFGALAIEVLRRIPGAARDLIWLAERSDQYRRSLAVEALCDLAQPDTLPWLLRHALDDTKGWSGNHARRIAEVTDLATVLDAEEVDPQILTHAARLLIAMSATKYDPAEIGRYQQATAACAGLTRHAHTMPPTLDNVTLLARLAEDLHTGHAALLPGSADRRASIAVRLQAFLGQPLAAADGDTGSRRTWLRRSVERSRSVTPPSARRDGLSRVSVQVVVADPASADEVEVRVLIDGAPIVARAFDRGCPHAPELLLSAAGPLRATAEPHEVQLGEAYCSEGCCGALYVTIERDPTAGTVTWHRWRAPADAAEQLPAFRFDAAEYDAEIARAEADRGWEWPARAVARLVRARLDGEPDLLRRWDCEVEWVVARNSERDQLRVHLIHPGTPLAAGAPWLQFEKVVTVADHPGPLPDEVHQVVADTVIASLTSHDPKATATVTGGSTGFAARLGIPWPTSGCD